MITEGISIKCGHHMSALRTDERN